VVVFALVRMRSGHCVLTNARQVSSTVVIAVRVVWEVTRAAVEVWVRCGYSAFSLHLGGSSGKEVDVHILTVVGASSQTATIRIEARGEMS
jgi:hypothetical protein